MMKNALFTMICMVMVSHTAQADHTDFGFTDFGGMGFGLHRGGWHGDFGFHGLGGLGFGPFGIGGFDPERSQMRFEGKFEDLMTEYDTSLADIEDFYNSDEYTEIVDDLERLVDRYDWFLTGAERKLNRLDDIIAFATDDLAYYTDLLAEYEARDDLPEDRLDRIIERLTHVQTGLESKIDLLGEKQTTLSENLGTYQMFSDNLAAYLAEIVAAADGTTDSSADTAEILAVMTTPTATTEALAVTEDVSPLEASSLSLSAGTIAVPEPHARLLLILAAAAVLIVFRPLRRYAPATFARTSR